MFHRFVLRYRSAARWARSASPDICGIWSSRWRAPRPNPAALHGHGWWTSLIVMMISRGMMP
jgi:hypothetical protein